MKRQTKSVAYWTLLIVLFSWVAVFAQETETLMELSLEDILDMTVVTAGKKSQSISEAPAIMSVITSDEIDKLGVQGIPELLSYVPGFTTMDTYWKRAIVTARGVKMTLYNDKILMLIDGIPAYDAAAMEHFLDTVPLSAIDRIEIIRGPGSTLYGTNAFSAVINIITKSGEGAKGMRGFVKAGSFSTREVGVSYGGQQGDCEYFFAGQMKDNDGYDKETNDEAGIPGVINFESDIHSLFGKIRYKSLTVSTGYSMQRFGKFGPIPRYYSGNRGHRDGGKADHEKFYVNGVLTKKYSDKFSTKFSLHYDYADKQTDTGEFGYIVYYQVLGVIDTTVSTDYYRFGGKLIQGEVQGEYSVNENTSILAGFTAERRTVNNLADLYSDIDGDLLIDGSTKKMPFNVSDFGGYIQLDGKLGKKLGFVAGLRFSYLGISEKSYLTPRGGLVYNMNSNTSVKFLYGEAFRGAGPQEQYYKVPAIIYGSDATGIGLEPERIRTIEVALDQKFADKYKFRINAFLTNIFDLIGRDAMTPSEYGSIIGATPTTKIYRNLGDQAVKGVEAEIKGYPSDKFNFFLNMTYKSGTDDASDTDIMYMSNLTANGGFSLAFGNKCHLIPNFQYVGKRKGTLNNGTENSVDAILLANLVIKFKVSQNMDFYLTGLNLLNKEYFYPEQVRKNMATIPGGPGRSIFFKADFRLQ
ncbi:TonB-dependent receptor [bacterium]|nr:TonB-dependent receptor [bacterium]